MTPGRPHITYGGCWAWGPAHYDCAVATIVKALDRETVLNLPMLTAEDVARLIGAKAERGRHIERLLGVPMAGTRLFPSFQFSPAGDPLPVVMAVNEVLAASRSPWDVAEWWVREHAGLEDQQPYAVLGTCWEADLLRLAND